MNDMMTRNPRQARCRWVVVVVTVFAIIAVLTLALALGLYYGLKSDDTATPQKHVPLKVLSVSSEGLVQGVVKLTVAYHALPDHNVGWAFRESALIRSAGHVDRKTLNGDIVYECSNQIDMPIETIVRVFVSLYSGPESIQIFFNLTTIVSAWTYKIPQWKNMIVNAPSSIVAPKSENLTVPIVLKADFSSNIRGGGPDVFFTALNTSANPPKVFEEFLHHDENSPLKIEAPPNPPPAHTPFQVNVTAKEEIAQYGGILGIRLPEEVDTKYIEQFKHGVEIDVVREDTKEVVPKGVVGVFSSEEEAPFFGNALSVLCFAMGNPSPDVKILKKISGNRYREEQSETLIKDRWTRLDVLTLRDKTTQSGDYTCRAKSGTMTSSFDLEVFAAEMLAFVDNETRVLESTADRTVVQCTATGIPTPVLSFKLFYEYGPDMIESGRYQYERNVNDNTVSLRMTISPVDVGIHQVYCRGSQLDDDVMNYKLVVLFPNESKWNHTLYNQLAGV